MSATTPTPSPTSDNRDTEPLFSIDLRPLPQTASDNRPSDAEVGVLETVMGGGVRKRAVAAARRIRTEERFEEAVRASSPDRIVGHGGERRSLAWQVGTVFATAMFGAVAFQAASWWLVQ